MNAYQNYQATVQRFPVLLKNQLFPTLSDKEITDLFLSLAEKDYNFDDLCPFIKRDFERLLSLGNEYSLGDEEKEILCGLAFEVISIYEKNPKIAVLVCMMYCCWHTPEDEVHGSANLDSALGEIYSFCFLCPDKEILNILNEASLCFGMYYKMSFFESVLIYLCTCEILQKEPNYESILQSQFKQNKKNTKTLYEELNWNQKFLNHFINDKYFHAPPVNKVDSREKLNQFREYLISEGKISEEK